MKLEAIVHCNNPEITEEIMKFLIEKGYAVGQSSVQIETGTDGLHSVKRLDVMTRVKEADVKKKSGTFDFNRPGHIMSLFAKISKHMRAGDCGRLKDYICSAFDTFDPTIHKDHPCYEVLNEAVNYIRSQGWEVRFAPWKNIGNQLIVIDPEGGYYHSNFDHTTKTDIK